MSYSPTNIYIFKSKTFSFQQVQSIPKRQIDLIAEHQEEVNGGKKLVGPGAYEVNEQFIEGIQRARGHAWGASKVDRFAHYRGRNIEIGPGKYEVLFIFI